MAKIVLIGVEPHELNWLRILVALLRHPDPGVPELAREALLFLTKEAGKAEADRPISFGSPF